MKEGITKKEFIDKYTELLRMTREGISFLELQDDETVIIHYENSFYTKKVNIACNSAIAIIKDVAKQIGSVN